MKVDPVKLDVILKWGDTQATVGHIKIPVDVIIGPADPETGELLTTPQIGGPDGMLNAVIDAFANLEIYMGDGAE